MYFGVPPVVAPTVRGMVRPLMPQPHGYLTARPYAPPPIRTVAPAVIRPPVYSRPYVMPGLAQREAERFQKLQLEQQRLQLQQQRLQFQQQQQQQAQQAWQAQQAQAVVAPPASTVVTSTPMPSPQPNVSPAAPESDLTPTQDAAGPEQTPKPHRGKLLLIGLVVIGGGVGIYAFTRKKKVSKTS